MRCFLSEVSFLAGKGKKKRIVLFISACEFLENNS